MTTTTSITVSSTGTSVNSAEYSEVHTKAVDTTVIATDEGEFIIALSRAWYDSEWNRYEPLCDNSQVLISREHAEKLLEILTAQLAK